jgi:hypothetical protein
MLRNLEAILASVLAVSAVVAVGACAPDVIDPRGGGDSVASCAVEVCGTSCGTPRDCGTVFHDCGGGGCGAPACGIATCGATSCGATSCATTTCAMTTTTSSTT